MSFLSQTDLAGLQLAYLDPGTGAMVLQLILAGVAGVVVFFKYQGRRFVGLFTGKDRKAGASESEED